MGEAESTAIEADAAQLWSFGGDYGLIGSVPVDSETVFGSASATPDNLMSYTGALITRIGASSISELPATVTEATYYEPQDGTVTDDWIVWRGATLDLSSGVGSTTDNWCVWAYERATGITTLIATAADLNGTAETPTGGGETVPSTDGTRIVVGSMVVDDAQNWSRSVLSYPVGGGAPATVEGDFPVAVGGAVLFAAATAHQGVLDTVSTWDGGTGKPQAIWLIRIQGVVEV